MNVMESNSIIQYQEMGGVLTNINQYENNTYHTNSSLFFHTLSLPKYGLQLIGGLVWIII